MSTAVRMRVLLLASACLVACAPLALRDEGLPLAERLDALGYRQGEAVASVQRFAVDGWQYLDKSHIILGNGPGGAYLITFSWPCRNLDFSTTLSFSTTVGWLTRLDTVRSLDGGGFSEQCSIGELHRLEKVPRAGD